jgi:hypothetical protein
MSEIMQGYKIAYNLMHGWMAILELNMMSCSMEKEEISECSSFYCFYIYDWVCEVYLFYAHIFEQTHPGWYCQKSY